MKFFASLPLPAAGIALATASLGRLLGAYAVFLQDLCGLTAATLLVCLLLRYVKSPLYKEEKENPLTAPIIPLLPMTILALSGYGSELHPVLGLCLWYIGFLWHGWYILDFTERTLRNFRLERVLPSWFVVYVGIVISVITMPLTADGTLDFSCRVGAFFLYLQPCRYHSILERTKILSDYGVLHFSSRHLCNGRPRHESCAPGTGTVYCGYCRSDYNYSCGCDCRYGCRVCTVYVAAKKIYINIKIRSDCAVGPLAYAEFIHIEALQWDRALPLFWPDRYRRRVRSRQKRRRI